MKIAIVIEATGGGSGRHVLDLARNLKDRHEITLFFSDVRAEPAFLLELAELPVQKVLIKMHREIGLMDLASYFQLYRALRTFGPFDVIHAHSSKAGALARMCYVPGAKIYTPHAFRTMDPTLGKLKYWFYAKIELLLSRITHHIILVSGQEVDHAEQIGIDKSKTSLIVNGVSDGTFREADRSVLLSSLGFESNDIILGYVGRLVVQKNPEKFLRVVKAANDLNPNIKGLMIGDGPLFDSLSKQSVQGPTTLLGWQKSSETMPAFNALVMTSRYEAMPYALIEALHCSLPIFAMKVGGTAETVSEGKNGYVFDQTLSAADIGQTIVDTFADSNKIEDFKRESTKLASQYTVTAMSKSTEQVYLKNPLVTVYLTTFNRLELLKRAVDSVLAQTHTNLELCIVDDNSSDGTAAYIEQLAASDTRVTAFSNSENKGACFGRNLALDTCRGEFVTGLDDDDHFHPNHIQVLLETWYSAKQPISAVTANAFLPLKPKAKILRRKSLSQYRDLIDSNCVGNQVLTRKENLVAIEGFDEALPILQDYDCWLRLTKKFGPIKCSGKSTYTLDYVHSIERITDRQHSKTANAAQHIVSKHDFSPAEEEIFQRSVLKTMDLKIITQKLLLNPTPYNFRTTLGYVHRKLTESSSND